MTKHVLAALACIVFVSAMAPAGMAEEKKLTPQQQKMKDCAGKWKDEKANKKVKGREAYRTFMGGCLRG